MTAQSGSASVATPVAKCVSRARGREISCFRALCRRFRGTLEGTTLRTLYISFKLAAHIRANRISILYFCCSTSTAGASEVLRFPFCPMTRKTRRMESFHNPFLIFPHLRHATVGVVVVQYKVAGESLMGMCYYSIPALRDDEGY